MVNLHVGKFEHP